jgi:hypothetical protein
MGGDAVLDERTPLIEPPRPAAIATPSHAPVLSKRVLGFTSCVLLLALALCYYSVGWWGPRGEEERTRRLRVGLATFPPFAVFLPLVWRTRGACEGYGRGPPGCQIGYPDHTGWLWLRFHHQLNRVTNPISRLTT